MKKWSMVGVLFVWVLFAYAQETPSAQDILARVSRTYQAFNSLEADFVFSVHSAQSNMDNSQKGHILLQKDRYKVTLGNQVFISDGKTQWTILKAEKEVQISDVDKTATLNPTNIFTFYKNGYIANVTGTDTHNGRALYEIELVPAKKEQSIFKIKMRIDQANFHIYDTRIYEKNGNQYQYQIKNLKTNVNLPAHTFTFNKSEYPDMEMVDLR